MKFESKYGMGEIVVVGGNVQSRKPEKGQDYLGEIMTVLFDDGKPSYMVDVQVPHGIQRLHLLESQIKGDPEFNQKTGYKK